MPRGVFATRVLPKLTTPPKPLPNKYRKKKGGPALYNAKRLVDVSQPIRNPVILKRVKDDVLDQSWRKHTSDDVAQFIDDMEVQGTKLMPDQKLTLLRNPAHYFSRPHNVPVNLRQQVYFPNFTITLRRNDYLGPYYATFQVPKKFSKLDLRAFLKELYNVDVVHIRSFVTPSVVKRKKPTNPYTQGSAYRTRSKKRMTVQLVEPFTWPVKPDAVDRSQFGTDEYLEVLKAQEEAGKKENDYFGSYLDKQHRKSIAQQAKDMLDGKLQWAPTWQQLPETKRMMTGHTARLSPEEVAVRSGKLLTKEQSQKRIEAGQQSTGIEI